MKFKTVVFEVIWKVMIHCNVNVWWFTYVVSVELTL